MTGSMKPLNIGARRLFCYGWRETGRSGRARPSRECIGGVQQ